MESRSGLDLKKIAADIVDGRGNGETCSDD